MARDDVGADTIESDGYNSIPVAIERDGFEIAYWQKAAEFFRWRNGRFVKWIMSD